MKKRKKVVSIQHDVIRPTPQQQTQQKRRGRSAVKKSQLDISKNRTDDKIEILINFCVHCESP